MANDEQASGRYEFLAWPIVLGMAVAIQAVTGDALIAALPIAVHAGWRPVRCGWWLRSVDPVRHRARACFWFYLATACWRAATYAFATVLIFALIEVVVGRPVPMPEVIAEFQILLGATVLSVLVGLAGIELALHGKVRVWVHPSVREKSGGHFSRLGAIRGSFLGNRRNFPYGFNHAIFVVIPAVVFPLPIAGTALIICRWAPPPFRPEIDVIDASCLLAIMVGPLVCIPGYFYLRSRIVANAPAECWSSGEEGRDEKQTL
jgi:hypothetical protein